MTSIETSERKAPQDLHAELMRLALRLAHVYSFVGDDKMPRAKQEFDAYARTLTDRIAELEARDADTVLLDFIRHESLDLRCFPMPTGEGDADIAWRVIQHHTGEPCWRTVGVEYSDDPRAAIRSAMLGMTFVRAVEAPRAEVGATASAIGEPDRWGDAAMPAEVEARMAVWLTNGAALHPLTKNLVVRFARALAVKLAAAEVKYGYSDGWQSDRWMDECRAKLMEHVAKGDPRDVAAYCAFLWHHGEPTRAASVPAAQSQPVATAPGWQFAPIEPTPEMLRAARIVSNPTPQACPIGGGYIADSDANLANRQRYANMLAAAPQAVAPTSVAWIEHKGGERPAAAKGLVDIRFSDGDVIEGTSEFGWYWKRNHGWPDIVAWRPHVAAQPTAATPAQQMGDALAALKQFRDQQVAAGMPEEDLMPADPASAVQYLIRLCPEWQ